MLILKNTLDKLTIFCFPNTQKDVLFIIGDWNAKVGSQELPGETGKFGLGVQIEAGQRLTESFVLFLICWVPYSLSVFLSET